MGIISSRFTSNGNDSESDTDTEDHLDGLAPSTHGDEEDYGSLPDNSSSPARNLTGKNFQLTAIRDEINKRVVNTQLEDIDTHTNLLNFIRDIEVQIQKDKLVLHSIRALDDRLFFYASELNIFSLRGDISEAKKDELMQGAQTRLMSDVGKTLHKEPSETKVILRVVATFAAALLLCYLTGGLSLIVTAASQCAAGAAAPSLQAIGIATIGTVGGAAAAWFGTKPNKPVGDQVKFFNAKRPIETFARALKKHYIGPGLP